MSAHSLAVRVAGLAVLCLMTTCGDDDGADVDRVAEAPAGGGASTSSTPVRTTTVETAGAPARSPASTALSTPTSPPTRYASAPAAGPDGTPVINPITHDSDSGPVEHRTCTYRPGELIAPTVLATEVGAVVPGGVAPIESISQDGGPLGDLGLTLYSILDPTVDPLQAAVLLAQARIDASPNYVFAFAPGWKYAPDDIPLEVSRYNGAPPLTDAKVAIGVIDTGYDAPPNPTTNAATNDRLAAGVAYEEMDGVAAGHGTFIVNLLGQLLPNAEIAAAAIEPRFDVDEEWDPQNTGMRHNIRDDATLTKTMTGALDPGLDYLNLSFGTYGCTSHPIAENVPVRQEAFGRLPGRKRARAVFDYREPLGLRMVLTRLASLTPDGSPTEVFAASGNDGHPPGTVDVFLPAAWAPEEQWLHSVASDPKDGVDYSNRDSWVETQARGTRTVSQLPATSWGPGGWYSWSGTSFATPCALALHAGQRYEDIDMARSDYLDCEANLDKDP